MVTLIIGSICVEFRLSHSFCWTIITFGEAGSTITDLPINDICVDLIVTIVYIVHDSFTFTLLVHPFCSPSSRPGSRSYFCSR